MSSMQGWRIDMEVRGTGLTCLWPHTGPLLLPHLPRPLHPLLSAARTPTLCLHQSLDKPLFGFFGVYDGHGGSLVAKKSAHPDGLLGKIMGQQAWARVDEAPGQLKEAIVNGFIEQDRTLR